MVDASLCAVVRADYKKKKLNSRYFAYCVTLLFITFFYLLSSFCKNIARFSCSAFLAFNLAFFFLFINKYICFCATRVSFKFWSAFTCFSLCGDGQICLRS